MALKLVGIVDYNDQVHCLDHASTVCSYRSEIYSMDPARECWCGEVVGGQIPSAAHFIKMTDGVKGRRAPARRTVARGRR